MLSKMFIDFNKVILALAVITPCSSTNSWKPVLIGSIAIILLTVLAYFLIKEEKNVS
jgi:uncharacterized membrane protein